MPGTRSTNTFSEALQRMLADLAYMKSLPDADLEWIATTETSVVQKIREPLDMLQQKGLTQVPPDPSMLSMPPGGGDMGVGGPGGADPMMAAMSAGRPPSGAMPPVPGVAGRSAGPNPDELRRLLSAQGQ